MVRARGGLSALGLNGFLARLLLFIDTNSALIMGDQGKFHLADVGGELLPMRDALVIPNPQKYLSYCGGGKPDEYPPELSVSLEEAVPAVATNRMVPVAA